MYIKTLSIVAASLLFFGCSVKVQPYHSEANEVYTSSSITTDATGVAGDDENLSYPKQFGVINAIDNNTVKYTLLVPTYEGASAYGNPSLALYNFNHAAFLTKDIMLGLVKAVDDAIADWNKEYPPAKGRNISYLSGSDKSSLDFHYQNGDSGEVAFLDINSGEEEIIINDDESISKEIKVYHFEIRDFETLKGFSYLLHKALKMQEIPVLEVENNVTVVDMNTTGEDNNISIPEQMIDDNNQTSDNMSTTESKDVNTTEDMNETVTPTQDVNTSN